MSAVPAEIVHHHRTHTNLFFFFFNDTATTEIYTLSLHDALPISRPDPPPSCRRRPRRRAGLLSSVVWRPPDRKSTRLNSSHSQISYAVFCLKKTTHSYRILAIPSPL